MLTAVSFDIIVSFPWKHVLNNSAHDSNDFINNFYVYMRLSFIYLHSHLYTYALKILKNSKWSFFEYSQSLKVSLDTE